MPSKRASEPSIRDALTNPRINAARARITGSGESVDSAGYVFLSAGKRRLADRYRSALASDLTRSKSSTTGIASVASLFTLSHTVNIDTHLRGGQNANSAGSFYRRDFPRCRADYPNSRDYHNKTLRPVNLPVNEGPARNRDGDEKRLEDDDAGSDFTVSRRATIATIGLGSLDSALRFLPAYGGFVRRISNAKQEHDPAAFNRADRRLAETWLV